MLVLIKNKVIDINKINSMEIINIKKGEENFQAIRVHFDSGNFVDIKCDDNEDPEAELYKTYYGINRKRKKEIREINKLETL